MTYQPNLGPFPILLFLLGTLGGLLQSCAEPTGANTGPGGPRGLNGPIWFQTQKPAAANPDLGATKVLSLPNGNLVWGINRSDSPTQSSYLVATTPGGAPVWTRTLGDGVDTQVRVGGLAVTKGGNLLVAGTLVNGAQTSLAYLASYGPSSQLLWSSQYSFQPIPGTNPDLRAVSELSDGSVVAVGTVVVNSAQCLWVLRVSSTGQIQSSRAWDITSDDGVLSPEAIGLANQGRTFAVAGKILTDFHGATIYGWPQPNWNGFVASFDYNTNLAWAQQYATIENVDEGFSSLALEASGAWVVGGTSSGCAAILKLLPTNGMILQSQTWGATDNQFSVSALQPIEGGLVAVGQRENLLNGDRDGWAFRADGTLSILWQKRSGGPSADSFLSALVVGANLYYAGDTRSFHAGPRAAWLGKGGLDGSPMVNQGGMFLGVDTQAAPAGRVWDNKWLSYNGISGNLGGGSPHPVPAQAAGLGVTFQY